MRERIAHALIATLTVVIVGVAFGGRLANVASAHAGGNATARLTIQSPVVALHIVNSLATVAHGRLASAEAAIRVQVNDEVAAHWGTSHITFTGHGVRIIFGTAMQVDYWCGAPAEGCHNLTARSTPIIYLERQGFSWGLETVALDHEIVEMMVDPQDVGRPEVCDPFADSGNYQSANGTWLADFAYPAFFRAHSHGAWDFKGWAAHALDYSAGSLES